MLQPSQNPIERFGDTKLRMPDRFGKPAIDYE